MDILAILNSQGFGSFIVFMTFCAMIWQTKVMKDEVDILRKEVENNKQSIVNQFNALNIQNEQTKNSAVVQNYIFVTEFLMRDDARHARGFVRSRIFKEKYEQWKKDDELVKIASTVCATFDTAAVFVKEDMIPERLIFPGWTATIIDCYDRLEPLIREYQRPEKSGSEYWAAFDWLYQRAKLDSEARSKSSTRSSVT